MNAGRKCKKHESKRCGEEKELEGRKEEKDGDAEGVGAALKGGCL